MMAWALVGPMPLRASNSSFVAVLMLIWARARPAHSRQEAATIRKRDFMLVLRESESGSMPSVGAPGLAGRDRKEKAPQRGAFREAESAYLVPMTSMSTRRSGCRQSIRALVLALPLHLSPVTGCFSPLPSV